MTSDEEKLRNYLNDALLSLARVEFINIIKVLPGHGQSIAFLIDELSLDCVVASVAGDDTILLISQNIEDSQKLSTYFHTLVE